MIYGIRQTFALKAAHVKSFHYLLAPKAATSQVEPTINECWYIFPPYHPTSHYFKI